MALSSYARFDANELAAHFERYSDVPKVAELKRRRDDCESALRAAVFEDFHVNWQPSVVASDASVAARLRDACAVVDMDAVFDAVLDALVPMPRRRGVRRARGVLGTTTTRDAIY